ncbi:hypothetical protein CAPTEDRAFT_184604 [Capitella teleta]|uniref:Ion transport domain-containing protein n=1 Tax=Capitella teleta TaxID=283909 RepID=R7UK23_CAPTE|nr:hypothetical protein CAPTEDRAFT_184604 [Capitella teleta]|eukprot:ELU06894.1 hypothetical protein CAPTEDRAFT_184604 [Capitella teleta]
MSEKNYKSKKGKGWKVFPEDPVDGYENEAYEMEDDSKSNNRSLDAKDRLKAAFRFASNQNNAINLIANIKAGTTRWRKYATTRRQISDTGSDGFDRRKTGGIGLDYEVGSTSSDSPDGAPDRLDKTQKEMVIACNRNLIEYFARLGQSKDESECINLEFVESLLNSGARIDCTDKYGQTIFHEVARAWHTDVAQFLLDHKCDVNVSDIFGRTPLHVAAAVDYPEMVTFLVQNGADIERVTKGEKQTPVHFAARNDACQSLKALVKCKALYKEVRDYKGRTPLHLAAELDRSETARFLLELPDAAPAGVEDLSGQAAIVWMIKKMPPVAKLALEQFHTTDRANRKQYYYLNCLEPQKPENMMEENQKKNTFAESALAVVVAYHQYDLILQSVFEALINLKWKRFGRLGAFFNTFMNLLFIVLWTILGILVPYDERYKYDLPEHWWRIVLFILALTFTGWQVKDELSEFFSSRKNHKRWCEWREAEITRDIDFAHPRWPEEEQFLRCEINELDKMTPQYFNDFWNIFDWICYALLTTCVITHLVDIWAHTNFVARLHIQIMAVTIIVIWLRLMKNARAFSTLGPFIVMLGHMFSDILKFFALYLEFYIPYACAFWMLFGGEKTPPEFQGTPEAANNTIIVDGYKDASSLLFSLFRLTLVDDYDYDGMKAVDPVMADILVGTWLALSAIVMLNLFIALMSDTFQRVYDNAKANAVMQKAITILSIEENMGRKRRDKFLEHIHKNCAPMEDFYDDDTTEESGDDLKKVTIQIKEQLDDLEENLREGRINMGLHGDSDDDDNLDSNSVENNSNGSQRKKLRVVTAQRFDRETTVIRDELQTVRAQQEYMSDKMKKDMSRIKTLLKRLLVQQMGSASVEGLAEEPGMTRSSSMRGLEYQAPQDEMNRLSRPESAYRGRTPHTGQRKTSSAYKRPTVHEGLHRGTEEDWEMSETRRKKELDDLRKELEEKALAATEDPPPPQVDILRLDSSPVITPPALDDPRPVETTYDFPDSQHLGDGHTSS